MKLLTNVLLSDTLALNDDLSLTLTVHKVAETRVSHDRRVDANMASKEHSLQYGVWIVDWTIYFRSNLCYLMNRLSYWKVVV